MADNQSIINKIVSDATKAASQDAIKAVSAITKQTVDLTSVFNAKDSAAKVVDSSLNKIIDDAIAKVKVDNAGKTTQEINDAIKAEIRSHNNAIFQAQTLIDAAVKDTTKQLTSMIDKQVQSSINANFLTQATRPLDVALHQVDLKISNELASITRIDVTKQMNQAISNLTGSPMKSIDVTLHQLHLDGIEKILDTQVAGIQTSLAKSITSNISASVKLEQLKIATFTKQIVEVEKQVKAFEDNIKAQIKAVTDKIAAEVKAVETKIISDITKSIIISF